MAQISTIEINTAPAKTSILDLEKALDNTNKALKHLDVNSVAFADLQKQAASLKGQIDQTNRSVKLLSKGFEGVALAGARLSTGLSGGITAATAAMQLMGVENENVLNGIAKLQQLMAFTQGIAHTKDLVRGFKDLQAVIGTSTKAAKLLNKALAPKWLLAITAAVTGLVIVWNRFGDTIKKYIPFFDKISSFFQNIKEKINDLIGSTKTLEENTKSALDTYLEYLENKKIKSLNAEAKKSFDKLGEKIKENELLLAALKENIEKRQRLGIDTSESEKQLEDITKHIENLKKQQKALLEDAKNYIKPVTKAIKEEINPELEKARKNLDLFDAKIYEKSKLKAGYLGSKEELLDQILRVQQLINIEEQSSEKNEAVLTRLKADLKALQTQYTQTYNIAAKSYGQFDISIAKQLEATKGLLKGSAGFLGSYTELEPLQEYLDVLFVDSVKLKEQLGELSADDITKFWDSEFFNKFYKNWYDNFLKAKKGINDAFAAGLITEETKNSYIGNIYASFGALSNALQEIGIDTGAEMTTYSKLQKEYLDELMKDPIAHLQFIRDYYIRLQEIQGTNYSYEIGLYEAKMQEIIAQKEETKNLIEDINTLGTSQYEQQLSQYEAQQNLLEEALSMRLITQEQFNEASKQLNKNYINSFIQQSTQGMNLLGDILGNIANMQDESTKEGFEKSKQLQIAQATINMLSGVIAATSGLFTTKTGPWDWVLAGLQTTAIITAGMANIAQIKKQTLSSASSGSVSSNVGSSTITPPTQYTQAVQGANIEQKLADSRVYLVESDVTNTQNRVKVQESENTY